MGAFNGSTGDNHLPPAVKNTNHNTHAHKLHHQHRAHRQRGVRPDPKHRMAGAVYVIDEIDADMASGPQRFYCHICKVKIDTVTDVSIMR